MHILFFSANPEWTRELHLERELQAVGDVLFWSIAHGQVRLEAVPEARRNDVVRYTATRRPDVLHFCGHGTSGALVLSDNNFEEDSVDVAWLRRSLRGRGIRVVVLNCCWSDTLASELLAETDVLIGCTREVENATAHAFAAAFYDGLQMGLTVRDAFEQARAGLPASGDGSAAPYQVQGKASVLDAPLLELASATRGAAGGNEPAVARAMQGSPAPPDAADVHANDASAAPAAQIAGLQQRLASLRAGLPGDIGWGLGKILLATGVGFAVYQLLHWIGTAWLGWEMKPAAGEKALDLLELEWVAIALFLAGGTATKLLTDIWALFHLRKPEQALRTAALLPAEAQADVLANGRLEQSITELEGTA